MIAWLPLKKTNRNILLFIRYTQMMDKNNDAKSTLYGDLNNDLLPGITGNTVNILLSMCRLVVNLNT